MRKILLVLFTLSLLAQSISAYESYSTDETKWKTFGYNFSKICIDNVFYIKGNYTLSVWINPKTLKPENCKGI